MDSTFKPGDRIKLRMMPRRTTYRDWPNRRGTVLSMTKTSGQVVIQWDDRRSRDFWPPRALEIVPEPEHS
jgi:hypothetical protein